MATKRKGKGRSVRSYRRDIARLKNLILDSQWYQPLYNGSPSCPFCGNQKHMNHSMDCPVLTLVTVVTLESGSQYRKRVKGRQISWEPINVQP